MVLADRPIEGWTLAQLVERVAPIRLELLTAPSEPVLVRGTLIEDPGDPLPVAPGTLLLLVGASADPEQVAVSLRRASAARFAGVVLKRRSHDLAGVLASADTLGLAVLAVADELPWREAAALLDAALTSDGPLAAEGQAPGEELFAIANAVATRTGGSVAIEDMSRNVLAYSSVPGQRIDTLRSRGILDRHVPDSPLNTDMYREVLASPGIVRYPTIGDELARAAIAIRAGTMPLGTLWVIEGSDEPAPDSTQTLEEAAQLAALHMLRSRSATELDRHLRGELLRGLLEGRPGADLALRRLGLPAGVPRALLAISPGSPDAGSPDIAQLAHQAARLCSALRPDAVTTAADRAVYVLLADPNAGEAARRLAAGLVPALDRVVTGKHVVIGIGSDDGRPLELASARDDADDALRALVCGSSPARFADVHDVRAQLLLLHLDDLLQRNPTLQQPALRQVVADNPERGSELLETLRAWFAARFDVRRAAAALHVHPNTLRYRLRRFEQLTGADLHDPDLCLSLWLQLRADQLTVDRGATPGGA